MMQQFHTQEYPAANRNYKDRLFRFVFNNKKDLLDLYNAINGTEERFVLPDRCGAEPV